MKTRKCLLSTLVMLFALVLTPGCGSKDNEAGDGGVNTNGDNSVNTSSVTINGRESCRNDLVVFEDFKTAVANGEFISQQYPIVQYYVQKRKQRNSFFYTTTIHTSRLSYDNGNLNHEYGNTLEDVRDALVAKLNDSTSSRFLSSGRFQFEVSNGDQYEIDLCSPLAANPLKYYDKSDKTYYQVSPQWYYYYSY